MRRQKTQVHACLARSPRCLTLGKGGRRAAVLPSTNRFASGVAVSVALAKRRSMKADSVEASEETSCFYRS